MERIAMIASHLCANQEESLVNESIVADGVLLITMNRPKALNAFNSELVFQLKEALNHAENNENVRVIILTGSDKAFAAGADISEMSSKNTIIDMRKTGKDNLVDGLASLTNNVSKPIIAAVKGYALGGGCEVAMMCDIIIASECAKFGQPEIKIGTIPGAGGTQRLIRAIGKSKAMEMCLTGNPITAQEAERAGLVSRVVKLENVLPEAIKIASQIANLSVPIVAICKESVNRSYELSLQEGLLFEKRAFQSTFGTKDRQEGMKAFVEKRKPKWTNQ